MWSKWQQQMAVISLYRTVEMIIGTDASGYRFSWISSGRPLS